MGDVSVRRQRQPRRTFHLASAEVDPRAALADGVALLIVTRVKSPDGERFGVSGTCCCTKLDFIAPARHGRPAKISLGNLISPEGDGESPAQTLSRLRYWSHSKEELHRWISELRRAHGDAVQLIVWDDTDYEIPWEMLWLPGIPGTELGQGWLGALMTVARWTTIRAPHGAGCGIDSANQCGGGVLAYVADGQMHSDCELLEGFGALMPKTLRDLIASLEAPGDRVALVYVACHGEYADTGFQFKLDGVSAGEMGARTYQRVVDSASLVFVNACHSARLIEDAEYNDATLRGFAETFLRSGAAGFVGTSGAVGEETAREAMRTILKRLRDDRETPIAAALRDYRRQRAVADVPAVNDIEAARALLPFFHSFMYVYYGSPNTTICLNGARVTS